MFGLVCSIAVLSFGKQASENSVCSTHQNILCIVTAFIGEATNVKITETVDVDIDFNYISSTADKVMSQKLLESDFTLEARNETMGDQEVRIKYYYQFIPASFN